MWVEEALEHSHEVEVWSGGSVIFVFSLFEGFCFHCQISVILAILDGDASTSILKWDVSIFAFCASENVHASVFVMEHMIVAQLTHFVSVATVLA